MQQKNNIFRILKNNLFDFLILELKLSKFRIKTNLSYM